MIDLYAPTMKADVAETSKAAKAHRDALRATAEAFAHPAAAWPKSVASDVETLNDQFHAKISAVGPLAAATKREEMEGAWSPISALFNDPIRDGVSQEIRAKLDLPTDTRVSCK